MTIKIHWRCVVQGGDPYGEQSEVIWQLVFSVFSEGVVLGQSGTANSLHTRLRLNSKHEPWRKCGKSGALTPPTHKLAQCHTDSWINFQQLHVLNYLLDVMDCWMARRVRWMCYEASVTLIFVGVYSFLSIRSLRLRRPVLAWNTRHHKVGGGRGGLGGASVSLLWSRRVSGGHSLTVQHDSKWCIAKACGQLLEFLTNVGLFQRLLELVFVARYGAAHGSTTSAELTVEHDRCSVDHDSPTDRYRVRTFETPSVNVRYLFYESFAVSRLVWFPSLNRKTLFNQFIIRLWLHAIEVPVYELLTE